MITDINDVAESVAKDFVARRVRDKSTAAMTALHMLKKHVEAALKRSEQEHTYADRPQDDQVG